MIKMNINRYAIINGTLVYIILVFSLWLLSVVSMPILGSFSFLIFLFLPAMIAGFITVRMARNYDTTEAALHGFLTTFILNVFLLIFSIIAITSSPRCDVRCLSLLNIPLIFVNVAFSTLSSTLAGLVYSFFGQQKLISMKEL